MNKKLTLTATLFLLLGGLVGNALGEVAATVDPNHFEDGYPKNPHDKSIGWRFFVDQEITITELGLYDHGDDGLTNSHTMGIWRVNKTGGLTLMREVEIGPGGVTEDEHVYVDIEDLTIVPDPVPYVDPYGVEWYERWIVGVWSNETNNDELIIRSSDTGSAWTIDAEAAGVIEIENFTWKNSDTFTAPWGNNSEYDYFGVNFIYSQSINTPPVANDDAAETYSSTPVTIDVLANDYDDDGDELYIDSVTDGVNGSVVINADETVTYTPDAGFFGYDSFEYTAADGFGGTDTATVYVIVIGVVEIDIKPNCYPNWVILRSWGVLPVAIFSSETFDATAIDPATVNLSGAGVAVWGRCQSYLAVDYDINDDGLDDLFVLMEIENLNPDQIQDGYGVLTGYTYDGFPIAGYDELMLFPSLRAFIRWLFGL